MALFGWGNRPTRAVPEQPFHAARVPMAQSIMDSHNPSYMTETVVEIVNWLLFDGGFTRAEPIFSWSARRVGRVKIGGTARP